MYPGILVPIDGSLASGRGLRDPIELARWLLLAFGELAQAGVAWTVGRRGVGRLVVGSDAGMAPRDLPMPVLFLRSPDAEA